MTSSEEKLNKNQLTMSQPLEESFALAMPLSTLTLFNTQFPIRPHNPGNHKLIQEIDHFSNAYHSPILIAIEDEQHLIENEEYLKRFYQLKEFPTKIELLSEYYKFHAEYPRIFIKDLVKIIQQNVQDKRAIQYQQVKKKMHEGQTDEPLLGGRILEPEQRLLADIELSYEDFQNRSKPAVADRTRQSHNEENMKKQIKQKSNNAAQNQRSLKRVISVHCKSGGFSKQCRQGLFLHKNKARNQNGGNKKLNAVDPTFKQRKKPQAQENKKPAKKDQLNYVSKNLLQGPIKQYAKSANVSSASSLSRSKSKSNFQNNNNNGQNNAHKLVVKIASSSNRTSTAVSISDRRKSATITSTNETGSQGRLKITPLHNKQPSTDKTKKSQSCKSLRIKTSLGVNSQGPSNQQQKSKRCSIATECRSGNGNGSSWSKDLQKPVNNMFKKIIQVRKR